MAFGRQYGYEFEHEATYDSMCLVNDAVYIAKDKYGWHATGAQFQHPIVFRPCSPRMIFRSRTARDEERYHGALS